jgi:hypothetical protein
MRTHLVFAGIGLAMVGCSSWPNKPSLCFSDEASISPTSTGEVRAFEFVKRRVGTKCRPASVECNLQLRHGDSGNIEVVVSRAMVSSDPPRCTWLDGGFETYVFSTEGKYIRVVLGL